MHQNGEEQCRLYLWRQCFSNCIFFTSHNYLHKYILRITILSFFSLFMSLIVIKMQQKTCQNYQKHDFHQNGHVGWSSGTRLDILPPQRQQDWKQRHAQTFFLRLHLQIFFCKYYIMFLTQQVPWAVQRALWEYGWMSVLGLVLSWEHLEAGGVCPMFMSGGSHHGERPGGSCLLPQETNATHVRPLLSRRTHLPLMTHAHTHINHTQKHVETVFLSILRFPFSMHTPLPAHPPSLISS